MNQIARVKCKQCERSFSDFQKRCPYCGISRTKGGKHLAKSSKSGMGIVMFLLIFLAFLAIMGILAYRIFGGDTEQEVEYTPNDPPAIAQEQYPIVEDDKAEEYDAETALYPEPEPLEIKVQFAGDILLHRGPIDAARTGTNTYDFRPFLRDIKPFIDGDLALVNMETPVDVLGENQDITTFPLFNAPFEILEALDYAGFNHIVAANNHSFDRGFSGLVATAANFERAGLDFTGIYVDAAAAAVPTIVDVGGIYVGIIAYTDSVNGLESLVPSEMLPYAVRRFRFDNLDSVPAMAEDIANLRAHGAEVVIVSLHWGAEYVDAPTEMQRQIARALAEQGADVIMGNHAHVIQPIEWHYRPDGSRSLLIYSLGNFLADQTRLNPPIARTQFGKLVNLHIIREPDGTIRLDRCEVLPTLCMRDTSGNTLGIVDGISVMPLFGGELPDFVESTYLRDWGRRAYEHVTHIIGEEFIMQAP